MDKIELLEKRKELIRLHFEASQEVDRIAVDIDQIDMDLDIVDEKEKKGTDDWLDRVEKLQEQAKELRKLDEKMDEKRTRIVTKEMAKTLREMDEKKAEEKECNRMVA